MKGTPPNGVNFTTLSAMATPGVPRTFTAKSSTIIVRVTYNKLLTKSLRN